MFLKLFNNYYISIGGHCGDYVNAHIKDGIVLLRCMGALGHWFYRVHKESSSESRDIKEGALMVVVVAMVASREIW